MYWLVLVEELEQELGEELEQELVEELEQESILGSGVGSILLVLCSHLELHPYISNHNDDWRD